jgi:DNA-directed RNA polymerase specialized sigma24 family protein
MMPSEGDERVDISIIRQAQNGDRLFLLYLLEEIETFVYRMAYYLLDNEDKASTASQESLIEIYRTIHLYNEKEDFAVWVQRKVTAACFKKLKAKKHHKQKISW